MADLVYLETTVISALFDERNDPVCVAQHIQMKQWYEQQASHYDLVTSTVAVGELRDGRYDHQAGAVAFAEALSLLDLNDEVEGVAQVYARNLLMPGSDLGDAFHLAIASVNEVDYLLTWNCRHLANPNKTRRIAEMNRRLGLMTPIIVTPAMLFWEEER